MALEKIYTPIGWQNKPSTATPLGSHNLSKIDEALAEIDERVVELSEDTEELGRRVEDAETDITKNAGDITTLENRFTGFSNDVSQGMELLFDKAEEAEAKIEKNTEDINALKIIPTASSSPAYMDDASNMGLEGSDFFGESKQNGTPTPTSPIPIESKIVNRVDVSGKNLLQNTATSQTSNGVTFTVNNDKSITTSGSKTGTSNVICKIGTFTAKAGIEYICSYLSHGDSQVADNYMQLHTTDFSILKNVTTTLTISFEEDTVLNVRMIVNSTTGKTYYPMIRLATITDATYETYKPIQTVNLSAPIELNGIGGVKDTIEIYADGSGKYIQRIGKMYTRNVSVVYSSSYTNPNGNVFIVAFSSWEKEILWTHRNKGQSVSTLTKDQYYVGQNENSASGKVIYFISDATTTASALAEIQAENSEIYYVLLNPIETALPQVDIDAIKNLHTYKPNTVVMNDADAEMDVHYVADPRLYIDKKFEALASAIVNQ